MDLEETWSVAPMDSDEPITQDAVEGIEEELPI